MIALPAAVDLPLRADDYGIIRVGKTRVTLDSVIADFHRDSTPEEIAEHFPTLKVADIYYVIGYYVDNQAEVDAYIEHQKTENERFMREHEAEHPSPPLTKAILEARLAAKRNQAE